MYAWYNAPTWTKPVLSKADCLGLRVNTSFERPAIKKLLTNDHNQVSESSHKSGETKDERKFLVVVTPTYQRITQIPDLMRMKQSLMLLADKVLWIVIEDSVCRHNDVYEAIKDFPNLIYLNQELSKNVPSSYNKGARQRNLAILLIRKHLSNNPDSIVYFADDDNTYNSALLPLLLQTKRLSVFNVGLVNEDVEGPMADSNGKFATWRTKYMGRMFSKKRKFCIDMAGFAVSVKQLKKSGAIFDLKGTRGYLEDDFLESLGVKLSDLEVLTTNIAEVVAWHTKTSYMISNERVWWVIWSAIRNAFYFFILYSLVIVCLHRMKLMKS